MHALIFFVYLALWAAAWSFCFRNYHLKLKKRLIGLILIILAHIVPVILFFVMIAAGIIQSSSGEPGTGPGFFSLMLGILSIAALIPASLVANGIISFFSQKDG